MAVARCAFSEGGRSGGGLSIGPGMFVGARASGAPRGRARLNRGANQRNGTPAVFKECLIFYRRRKEKHKQRGHWTGERWQMCPAPATLPSAYLPSRFRPNTSLTQPIVHRAKHVRSGPRLRKRHVLVMWRPPFNSMLIPAEAHRQGQPAPTPPPRSLAPPQQHTRAASSVPVWPAGGGRGGRTAERLDQKEGDRDLRRRAAAERAGGRRRRRPG